MLGKKSIVDDPSHCDPVTHACDQTGLDAANDGKTFSTVSTVGFIGGGAVLAVGVVLFVAGGSKSNDDARGAARAGTAIVTPSAIRGGAGLARHPDLLAAVQRSVGPASVTGDRVTA